MVYIHREKGYNEAMNQADMKRMERQSEKKRANKIRRKGMRKAVQKAEAEKECPIRNELESIPELPPDFLEKMKGLLGEQWEAFLRSYEQPPKQGLRVNLLKGSAEKLICSGLFGLKPVLWAEDGFYYEPETRPGKHPFHEAGVYYIQEPSAMAVAGLLQVRPGERVLDLCAAPGGKTTQLAAAMKGEGLLVSNEIHPGRAKILSQNVERMGIRNCLVTNEAPETLALRFPAFFHKILVDAPCSGEGMFRKEPQSRTQWSPENVSLCARRQIRILECAARMLVPGGRLVYSTCTFSPEEDEENAEAFLARHPEFEKVEALRLWPHLAEGEGHFAAVFRKVGDKTLYPVRMQEGISEKELPKEYTEFAENVLRWKDGLSARSLAFGEHLYLFPEQMPDLRGLKALRPGLELGQVKKNRFVPAHGLALALRPEEAVRHIELSASGQEIFRYLHGETIPAEIDDGWCLVCVEGYSLGWGKAVNGQLKNHYPKGLRWN